MGFALVYLEEFAATFERTLPESWTSWISNRERFGSWEWEAFTHPDKRLPRAWTALCVTPTAAVADRATRAVAETWAIGEKADRFHRELVASSELPLTQAGAPELIRRTVSAHVLAAAERATELRSGEVQTRYLEIQHTDAPIARERASEARIERVRAELPELVRSHPDLTLEDVAGMLGTSQASALEIVLIEVRRGRVQVEQRGRQILLRAGTPELPE